MAEPLRWGVLGATSRIAQKAVMPAIVADGSSELAAVASRSGGDYPTLGAKSSYDDYQALLDDEGVDAVYIPLPNSLHLEWTVRAAEAGKHVLCEKPLASNAAEATEMALACTRAGVTLMEAYMTPFHPRSEGLHSVLTSGRLGRLRWACSTFTFPLADDHRWNPDMGGGALLDLGVYCLSPLLAAGEAMPARSDASMTVGGAGVDGTFSGRLDFGNGLSAAFVCSFEAPFMQRFEAIGTDGAITIDERPFTPTEEDRFIHLTHRSGRMESIDCGGGNTYGGMVEHFAAVVRGEARPRRTPAEAIELLTLQDGLRRTARVTAED